MTSIPANVQNFLAGSRTGQPKVQTDGAKEDFGKVLDRQKTVAPKENSAKTPKQTEVSGGDAVKDQGKTEPPREAETDKVVQTEGGEVKNQETADVQDQQQETVEVTDRPKEEMSGVPLEGELSGEELEQVMEVLQSAILQIQELLVQQLNISPQELEQVMQKNGFTELQLLQPETVNQLILDATGAEDSMTLVMDENLYQSQQTITQGFQEITQKLEGELKEDGGLPKVLESLESLENMSVKPLQDPDATAESLQQEDSQGNQGRQEHDEERSQTKGVTGPVLYQNYTSQAQNQMTVSAGTFTSTVGAAYADIPDSQQVMNQILDYMKVSMKPEDTVLNMQLHPENLGTLHIQITAREGIMTAHFTASSEAVKTVLENQMIVLKENFEQQDIKVDAIEVTVEPHQFESNLEQGRQRGEEESGRRPRRRKLDVSSLESGEELAEPDQILTEMMAASGTSVDYLA